MTKQKQSSVGAAAPDESRLQVLARLCEKGPLSITELTQGSQVSRQAITKHLRVLAAAGLVKGSRDGRESRWNLERKGLLQARRWLDKVSHEWDERLDRLRAFVEHHEVARQYWSMDGGAEWLGVQYEYTRKSRTP